MSAALARLRRGRGQRARLVEHDRVHFRETLQRLAGIEMRCARRISITAFPRRPGALREFASAAGEPRLALAPALAFAQHFDETDFDDDARGSPGERLLANKLGVRCTLASRLRVEGDEPVETVEEIGKYIAALRSSANSYAFR